jgi:hypothetical protein
MSPACLLGEFKIYAQFAIAESSCEMGEWHGDPIGEIL